MKRLETHLFLDDFKDEAKTHVEKIEAAFLNINTLINNPKLMNNVFRAAHSLKGAASFFSLGKIVAVAHELESVFSQIKNGDLEITDELIDIVLQSVDCLKELIDNTQNDKAISISQLLNTLKKISGAGRDIRELFDLKNIDKENKLKDAVRYGHKIYYIDIKINKKNPAFADEFIRVISKSGKIVDQKQDAVFLHLLVTSVLDIKLFSIAVNIDTKHIHLLHNDIVFNSDEYIDITQTQQIDTSIERTGKKTAENESHYSMRLDISVINELLDISNEMILIRNQLFSVMSDYTKTITGLAPVMYDINRLTSEVQNKIMSMRMQPISVIFAKFPRVIRDTAKSLGKDIAVEIIRDDVHLDKYLLEALTDPITQIVKNSASHGLESIDVRTASGKPQKGIISLTAYKQDGSAIIEVKDDGAGIDTNAIKQKALELGITTKDELSLMTEKDVFDFIFEPGVSTSSQITKLSGRGFGMDIVKTNIERLGGSIEIESKSGFGTTVRLIMPITLSVINTLIVTIDSIQYAVPELNIERIVRINNESISRRIERVNKSLVLVFNGRIIPVVTIKEIETKVKDLNPVPVNTLMEQYRFDGITKCLVLKTKGKSFALLIDDALDTEQILVKPLPVFFQNCPCYSNVTVLGNGNAVTVINAEGIMLYMGLDDVEKEAARLLSSAEETAETEKEKEPDINKKQIVLFKCSGPEYFAVGIEDILRIESIYTKDIQEIGSGFFINIAGKTIRLLKPEDYSPVTKQNYTSEKLYVLTLKNSNTDDTSGATVSGLLAGKVLDKIEGVFTLNKEQIQSDFVLGTSAYNEKIIIFLNPAAIISVSQQDNRGVL
ncbi:MAG: chemotaxis protein CheA [Treponema sp.]|nr:chemotaxis protein CheA [Treponema sp.]